jgi:hypothetical protein
MRRRHPLRTPGFRDFGAESLHAMEEAGDSAEWELMALFDTEIASRVHPIAGIFA